MLKTSGIYCIENTINNKKYIGSSINIESRIKNHKLNLKKNSHPNRYLQKEYNENKDSFIFYIIKKDIPKKYLLYFERYFILENKTINKMYGYNEKIPTVDIFSKEYNIMKKIIKHERNKVNMKVELISYTPEPARLVAKAAKLCYSKSSIEDITKKMTDDEVNKFVSNLFKMGHLSPFEHVSFTFAIEGISRSCSHQLVRHRIASYSQQSQRYVDMIENGFVIPSIYENNIENHEIYDIVNDLKSIYGKVKIYTYKAILKNRFNIDLDSYNEYKNSLENQFNNANDVIELIKEMFPDESKAIEKEVLENSRAFLPNASETKIIVTMNARSLFNFFSLRCCNRAQEEIRTLAIEMLNIVKSVAPEIFRNAGPKCLNGKCPEGKMSCGKPWTE